MKLTVHPASASRRAFTLIEVLIGAALMSIILVTAYMCLHSALQSQKMIEPRATVFQSARVAMAQLSADLRAACPLSKDADFLGMHRMIGPMAADNLDFATHNYTPRRDGEGDYCQLSYFLEKDPTSGQYTLYRRRNPVIALDATQGGTREEVASGLLGLQFDYYDGFEWYDTWGETDRRAKSGTSRKERYNLEGMPEAVRITMWFDANPQSKPAKASEVTTPSESDKSTVVPLVFQTVARLNLVRAQQDTGTGGSDTSGQPDNGASGAGVTQ